MRSFLIMFLGSTALKNIFDHGVIIEKEDAYIVYQDGNEQTINLNIDYPFEAENIEKYKFHELENCNKILESLSEKKVQNTIDFYFDQGLMQMQKKFGFARERRQAVIIGLSTLATTFFFEKIITFFHHNGGHHVVKPSEHMKQQVQHIMCELLYEKQSLLELRHEIKAKELVQTFFENLQLEVEILRLGTVRGSSIENLFIKYCSEVNSNNACNKVLELSTKNVLLIDFGFLEPNRTFHIQIQMNIPLLFEGQGVAYNILAPYIPIENSNSYRKTVVKNFVKISNYIFYKEKCRGDIKVTLICSEPIWETQIIEQNFQPEYITKRSNKKCIVEIFENKFSVSNFEPTRVTKIEETQLSSTTLERGIHIFEKNNNFIISCSNLTYKVFKNKIRSKNLIENVNSKLNLTDNFAIYHKSFGLINDEQTYSIQFTIIFCLIITFLVTVTVLFIFYYRKFYKVTPSEKDNFSIKSTTQT